MSDLTDIDDEPAANDGHREHHDLDVPYDAPPAILLPSEELDAARHAQPSRPDRGRLHGADNPWGWCDSVRRREAGR